MYPALSRTPLRTFFLFSLLGLMLAPQTLAQDKRPLQHEDIYDWMRLGDIAISRDGDWAVWTEAPDRGDGTLMVSSTDGNDRFAIPRGADPVFSGNSRYVLFRIVPQADSVRQMKMDEVAEKDLPADSLGILTLADGSIERYADIQSFGVSDEDGALAWWKWTEEATEDAMKADSTASEKEEEEEEFSEESEEEEEEEDEGPDKKEGVTMTIKHLDDGNAVTVHHVTEALVDPNGVGLVFFRESEEGEDDGVYIVGGSALEEQSILTGMGNYVQLALSEDGQQLAFLTNRDDFDAEQPSFTLFAGNGPRVEAMVSEGDAGLPEGWWVSKHGNVSFSESGQRVFFGTAPKPEPEPEDDDVLDEEKVSLDIWNWKDPLLQPMQLVQASREKERSFQAVVHFEDGSIVQLASADIPTVRVADKGDGDVAIGVTNMPYQQEISWDSPVRQDTWLIDVRTGERRMVLESVKDTPDLSPLGNYITWWDRSIGHWMMMDVDSGEVHNVTNQVDASFVDALDDRAYDPSSYGSAGWTEDDAEFVIYDKFDVWAASPDGSLRNVTEREGRKASVELRVFDMDRDEPALPADEEWLLRATNLNTMDGGFWEVDPEDGDAEPLVMSAHGYGIPGIAEEADVLLVTRYSYTDFPDLHVTDREFDDLERISWVNPQQEEFNWGTNELVEWTSLDGQLLKGILYKPEGFDPANKYPMMVYFYEKSSRTLHQHRQPSFPGSIINFPFYVSRGYLIFVPDIPYKTGYPGESAMNAVMPGVTNLIDQGFVDRDRIGVQGHSWGGYQIAYMITQTDLFAAAEAGAPVSNMTSAYGGIRWSSGLSRMFQYERTQSRIGGTLWNAQQRYIHNSPLFQADKVKTPVLMMHNDEDGAVPWYQGIEYFVALRRLGKPAWMINYNGAGHNLSDLDERRDWARRMQQFFDHYLMDAPAPVWMEEGIPAVKKGTTMGFEPASNR